MTRSLLLQKIFILSALIAPILSMAQQKVRLESSDYVEGGRTDGKRYNKVIGHVHFIQGRTEIFCDSAFFYKKENSLEAFGHIRIFDLDDSVNITSGKLNYSGDSRFAILTENVVYKGKDITLFTDYLEYNVIDKSARYFNGGRILNEGNELTSNYGFYDTNAKKMTFFKKVVFDNPENTLKSDTLYYDMVTKIANTRGPTVVISSDGSTVNSEKGGEFLMESKQTQIVSGTIETETYILKGKKLFYDKPRGINRAEGEVYLYSKNDNIVITGEFAENNQTTGFTKVYGNPIMRKLLFLDTLFLAADTLVSIDSGNDEDKRLLAYRNVRIFRFDLQGLADSLSYMMKDSVLFLYSDPIIWNGGNQIEADSISITIQNNQVRQLNLSDNAFMILTDTAGNFNQLKGKAMTGYFIDNKINSLDVNGNGECLFHALDEKDNNLIGVNRILCSSMTIRFVDNRANNMSFYSNPEASFIPPHELQEPDKRLSGFDWRENERPVLSDIYQTGWTRKGMNAEKTQNIPDSKEPVTETENIPK